MPVTGVGLLAIVLALHVQYERSPAWPHALKRVDFLGNAIFILGMTAIFFGLIWQVKTVILGARGALLYHWFSVVSAGTSIVFAATLP